jgi:tRNA A37 threonylcarbamoyltransferase TsaD
LRAARKAGLKLLVAKPKYNTDNAVMIAAAGYMTLLRKKKLPMRANGGLNI